MNYWLVKSDPEEYGWNDLKKDGETEWTGIRNYAARLHLNAMKKGDRVMFYHSNADMAVVGIASVAKEAYPDPTTDDDRWVAVNLKYEKPLGKPVTLVQIKAEKKLKNIGLVRIGRLSVMPLSEQEFKWIETLGNG